MQTKILSLILVMALLAACDVQKVQLFAPDHENFRYAGRVDFENPQEPVLVGSASYVEVKFTGDSCLVLLRKLNSSHNYVSMELDGEYLGRVRIDSDTMQHYPVVATQPSDSHVLRIFKATESANGHVAFGGIMSAGIEPMPPLPPRSIEFIGNSITCGMGVDWKDFPCHSGVWYDQHNAYWSYATQAAKALNAQFMLSSVSGIGVYRNWNSPGPAMPEVYEHTYLYAESQKKWDFTRYVPDLVSVCLGTNDFSDGDGLSERLPFDSANFVGHYIAFINTLYRQYPETQICLLTSPMLSGEKDELLRACVSAVKEHFGREMPEKKPIALFEFSGITPHGCDYHPDRDDQRIMAEALVPFYREVMEW